MMDGRRERERRLTGRRATLSDVRSIRETRREKRRRMKKRKGKRKKLISILVQVHHSQLITNNQTRPHS